MHDMGLIYDENYAQEVGDFVNDGKAMLIFDAAVFLFMPIFSD